MQPLMVPFAQKCCFDNERIRSKWQEAFVRTINFLAFFERFKNLFRNGDTRDFLAQELLILEVQRFQLWGPFRSLAVEHLKVSNFCLGTVEAKQSLARRLGRAVNVRACCSLLHSSLHAPSTPTPLAHPFLSPLVSLSLFSLSSLSLSLSQAVLRDRLCCCCCGTCLSQHIRFMG